MSGALAACASAPAASWNAEGGRAWAARPEPPAPDASPFGLYLAGEAALDDGAPAARRPTSSARPRDGRPRQDRAEGSAPSPRPSWRARCEQRRSPGAAACRARRIGAGRASPPAPWASSPARSWKSRTGHDRVAYELLSAGSTWASTGRLRRWCGPGRRRADGDCRGRRTPRPIEPHGQDRAVAAFGKLNTRQAAGARGKAGGGGVGLRRASRTSSGVFALAYGGFLERRGRRSRGGRPYTTSCSLAKDPDQPGLRRSAQSRRRRERPRAPGRPVDPHRLRRGADRARGLADRPEAAGGGTWPICGWALALDPGPLAKAWVLAGDSPWRGSTTLQGARAAYVHVVAPSSPEYVDRPGPAGARPAGR